MLDRLCLVIIDHTINKFYIRSRCFFQNIFQQNKNQHHLYISLISIFHHYVQPPGATMMHWLIKPSMRFARSMRAIQIHIVRDMDHTK